MTAHRAYDSTERALSKSRILVVSSALALVIVGCALAILLWKDSVAPVPHGHKPVLVTGDKRFAEHEWLISVRGAEYGLIQWSGNDYRRRGTLIVLDQLKIEVPCRAIWIAIGAFAVALLAVWVTASGLASILKRTARRTM